MRYNKCYGCSSWFRNLEVNHEDELISWFLFLEKVLRCRWRNITVGLHGETFIVSVVVCQVAISVHPIGSLYWLIKRRFPCEASRGRVSLSRTEASPRGDLRVASSDIGAVLVVSRPQRPIFAKHHSLLRLLLRRRSSVGVDWVWHPMELCTLTFRI